MLKGRGFDLFLPFIARGFNSLLLSPCRGALHRQRTVNSEGFRLDQKCSHLSSAIKASSFANKDFNFSCLSGLDRTLNFWRCINAG